MCTVFAESEVINHLSNGVSPDDIMLGAGMLVVCPVELTGKPAAPLMTASIK